MELNDLVNPNSSEMTRFMTLSLKEDSRFLCIHSYHIHFVTLKLSVMKLFITSSLRKQNGLQ